MADSQQNPLPESFPDRLFTPTAAAAADTVTPTTDIPENQGECAGKRGPLPCGINAAPGSTLSKIIVLNTAACVV